MRRRAPIMRRGVRRSFARRRTRRLRIVVSRFGVVCNGDRMLSDRPHSSVEIVNSLDRRIHLSRGSPETFEALPTTSKIGARVFAGMPISIACRIRHPADGRGRNPPRACTEPQRVVRARQLFVSSALTTLRSMLKCVTFHVTYDVMSNITPAGTNGHIHPGQRFTRRAG